MNIWQGILILLLGIVSLFVYVAFDINSKVVLSRNLLTGRNESLESSIREGFFSIGKLINIYEEGIGVKKNAWLAKKLREKYEEAVKQ